MPIPDPDKLTVEIAHVGTVAAGGGATRNFANVYHFRRTSIGGAYDNVVIANEFIAAMVPTICAALSADYTTIAVTARCLDDALDPGGTVTDATAGAIAGQRLPDYVAAVLIFRTALRGRNYRGRKHYGPIVEADTTGDVLTAGAITRMGNISTALSGGMTDANANTWVQCVVSKTLSQLATNPTNVVYANVNQTLVNHTVGTLRRRKVPTVR